MGPNLTLTLPGGIIPLKCGALTLSLTIPSSPFSLYKFHLFFILLSSISLNCLSGALCFCNGSIYLFVNTKLPHSIYKSLSIYLSTCIRRKIIRFIATPNLISFSIALTRVRGGLYKFSNPHHQFIYSILVAFLYKAYTHQVWAISHLALAYMIGQY